MVMDLQWPTFAMFYIRYTSFLPLNCYYIYCSLTIIKKMGHHTETTKTKTRPKIHHRSSHKSNHYKSNNSQRAGLLLSKIISVNTVKHNWPAARNPLRNQNYKKLTEVKLKGSAPKMKVLTPKIFAIITEQILNLDVKTHKTVSRWPYVISNI
jgi:hypothetical protein